jgi:hypothetical protein
VSLSSCLSGVPPWGSWRGIAGMPLRQGCLSPLETPAAKVISFFNPFKDIPATLSPALETAIVETTYISPQIAPGRCCTGSWVTTETNATASIGRINRLNNTAVILCRRVHPGTYRIVNECSGSFGSLQGQDFWPGSDGINKPAIVLGRIDNNRHARRGLLHHRTGWFHQNAAAIPHARECEHTSIPQPLYTREPRYRSPRTIHKNPSAGIRKCLGRKDSR